MMQVLGVRELVQQDVIYELPRKLHQEKVDYDVTMVVAATPPPLKLLGAQATVVKTVFAGQPC